MIGDDEDESPYTLELLDGTPLAGYYREHWLAPVDDASASRSAARPLEWASTDVANGWLSPTTAPDSPSTAALSKRQLYIYI